MNKRQALEILHSTQKGQQKYPNRLILEAISVVSQITIVTGKQIGRAHV